ncbi:hypothetical protein GMDG_00640 [Pseudogymnoascus destructans 20631-21]|uniref:Uncharacterized protein n=1 Tax=Pseudogymnoascus destructans (strain ATCC MYA-4855 / 20631-21) TaxID=658429 RepID=L8G7D8_PSED2|nr:hypothetical protein GMDG_00640 [Pseudogymnoascus destructans 20631-21]
MRRVSQAPERLSPSQGHMLAGEINNHAGNLEAGIMGYEEQMRPVIAKLQKAPPLIRTILAPQTAWGLWVRNRIFAFVAWSRILKFTQKYFASAFASSDKFGLPEYEWVT